MIESKTEPKLIATSLQKEEEEEGDWLESWMGFDNAYICVYIW